ncbi:hypothetical protein WQE_33761 [Paraburkholderia hospita]|uniref:Uncharacterized protein n=1 Tax=Paraburkholderia hospita TaxID=169430 RepID=A0ABP2PF76_9BURK|nr:hypothetical protein WQE_33761 [Paraburkholderia hospita]OUL93495.1 hypothetical protein CA602_00745 [Paraburkholderia hospita]
MRVPAFKRLANPGQALRLSVSAAALLLTGAGILRAHRRVSPIRSQARGWPGLPSQRVAEQRMRNRPDGIHAAREKNA